MDEATWSYEHKLLFNGLLFCALRSHDSVDEKLLNIEKYIENGADINAQDFNDKCNTPLHVAVKLGKPEIIKFLLHNAANHNTKNQDLYTPIELARISHNKSIHEVIAVLETYSNEIIGENEKHEEKTESDIFVNKKEEKRTNEPSKEPNTVRKYSEIEKSKPIIKDSKNESRSGSAGIRGQLFETKLLGLLLHRATIDSDIDEFYLGGNVSGLGAFDDIVFKYKLKNEQKPVYIFVQAKHKQNPENQGNITVQSLTNRNSNNEFNLAKFFQSYLNVQKKFNKKAENKMFRNDFGCVDCKFIIYTSAFENFHKMKLVNIRSKDKLLITADKGKTFMYDYDDSDLGILLSQTSLATAKSLANSFATNIASQKSKKSKKSKNMMFDDLIRIYHVYLADNVVNIEINETNSNYNFGSFRNSFLTSSDQICILMREAIIKGLTSLDCFENLDSIKFLLPKTFGNSNISFDKNYEKIVEKLLKIKPYSKNTIEGDSITEKLKKQDIKLIGDLVGSVFILDKETDLFKINTESSSDKIKEFVQKLNDFEYVKKLRFNITTQNFPQLSLIQHQRKVMKHFLDKIIFFTNQATEDKVEVILKKELAELYNSEANDSFYQIKGDAIYLFYHDSIQKWWKDSKKTNEFLNKSCQFYSNALKNIVLMPLVNVLSYVYVQKLNGRKLNFEEETLKLLKLQEFMTESGRCLSIVTKDTLLTSIKVNIFFQNNLKTNNYKFISSEDIVEKAICDIIISETTEMMDTIIFVLHDNTTNYNFQMVYDRIIEKSSTKHNKVIIITRNKLILRNSYEIIDNFNRLCDLDTNIRQDIIQYKTIIYQGYKVPFKSIVDMNMHSLIKGKTLHKLIENESVVIGKEIAGAHNIKDIYLKRRICRCLVLSKVKYSKEFRVLYKNGVASAKNEKDILIISDDDEAFEKNVKKHPDKNIHWFKKISETQTYWMKSHGTITKLFQIVKKTSCIDNNCSIVPQKLNDLSDRVVIISADPGMGKSTILTHLSNQTKFSDKSLCIIKLNLIELENDFLTWQQCNSDSKLIWLLQFLYKSFSKGDNQLLTSCSLHMKKLFNNVRVYGNRVILVKDIATDLYNEPELAFFELQVFLNAYNDEKIALVIDGFDEICPNYKTECIEIFQLLLTSRVKRLWISTRPYLNLNELEIELNTFSFSMVGFSKDDQLEYLQKFWENYLYEIFCFDHPRPLETIKMITEQFYSAVSHKIKDNLKYFSSIPLHLNMIAEVYKKHFSNYLLQTGGPQLSELLYDAFNLISLYEKFIDIKFDKIRLGQISSNSNDPVDRRNKLAARKSYVDDLKKLAAYKISTKKASMLSKQDLKTIPELERSLNLEKTSIVMLTQGKLEFVHRTFAEYFACEFLCDQVKGDTRRAWEKFINHILVMDDEGIRRFIDAKLEKDQILSNYTSKYICEALLKQTTLKKSALHVAVLEERVNVVTLLLKNVEEHIEMEQLDDFLTLLTKRFKYRCTLCEIYYRNIKSAMKISMEIIKRIDQNKLVKLIFCEDNPACNIFIITFLFFTSSSRMEIMDTLLSYTKSADIAKLLLQPLVKVPGVYLSTLAFHKINFNYPPLHALVQFTDKTQIYKYLENLSGRHCLAVLRARDDMGRMAAHWAALYSNHKFFDIMEKIIKCEPFKKICTSKDKLGYIPLRYFGITSVWTDWYKAMCAKIGIEIGFKKEGGWYLYDIENPETIW